MEKQIEFFNIAETNGYYSISKCGKVRRNDSGRILKPFLRPISGYWYVGMCLGSLKNKKHESIHRLLCLTFKPNLENKRCVNHIDAIRTNNNLDNLEWATYSENNHHTFVVGNKTGKGSKNPTARQIIDKDTGFIFDCIKDISEHFKINYSHLRCAVATPGRYENIRKRFEYV